MKFNQDAILLIYDFLGSREERAARSRYKRRTWNEAEDEVEMTLEIQEIYKDTISLLVAKIEKLVGER